MALTSASRLARPRAVFALRSSIWSRISSSVSASVRPSTSKNWPNSRLDWLARVTICFATGARSCE